MSVGYEMERESILIGTVMTSFEPYNLYWQELLLEQSSRWLRSITEEIDIKTGVYSLGCHLHTGER